jgi:hypothetical protein
MPFERGKVLHYGEAEMPWNMKVDGHIRKCRQEDKLNSEKCGVADSLGRLSEMEEGLGKIGLKEVGATARMLKIPISDENNLLI